MDIETVRAFDTLEEVPERLQEAWQKKAAYFQRISSEDDASVYEEKAGIFAEFGKIVVIGLGFFHQAEDQLTFRTRAISGANEKALLEEFSEVLQKFDLESLHLCAHNGKHFDFPYLSRRMLINGVALPEPLRMSGKKPWEIRHLDTMDMWRFGDFRHFVSLELLAALFNITSSKSDFDGSQVNDKYYRDNDLAAIAAYCLRDVEVTAHVFLHLTGRVGNGFTTIITNDQINPEIQDE